MESIRARYSFKKLSVKIKFLNDKGIALVGALLIGVLSLLIIAGIYFALTKLFGSSQTIKTYSSVRDAAAGGVHYAVATKVFEMYHQALNGDIDAGTCDNLNLQFKLQNTSGTFKNKVTVCYLGKGEFKTGFGKERVIGSGTSKVFEYWLLFSIVSDAEGPGKTHSTVEAVYAK